ncbi:DNA polymerase III, alpha subunit like protein, partial [Aduncisulcus paluster]
MEKVRKGKGLTDEDVELMKENNVPEWYIWSCNQIKYMFPKAHAVAYVMMSFRIAYFKVHHPLAFYATHYGIKVDDFDAQLVCQGKAAISSKMAELDAMDMNMSKKDQDL